MAAHSSSSDDRWSIDDRTFLLGPAFCAGFGNGILLGYLMYKSGVVPGAWPCSARRRAADLPVGDAIVLGAYDNGSTANSLLSVPGIAWEASLTIYLLVKAFRPSPILA